MRASSLAALDVACTELATHSADLVLCGAVDLHNGLHDFQFFTSVHALSPTGQSRTFDAQADGIALGEGVGCLVLKRLADAERDGDRVYAVVRAVGGSSDGRHLGLTAPRPEGQERALRRAYETSQLPPRTVGLVEAHGTGTVVGDRTELTTLDKVFTAAGAAPGSIVLGSVKSNIGHTKCTAGIAGVIKAAKSIYHGVLPPTVNLAQPNKAWDPETSPFRFLHEARPWLGEERIAGVSAFGFGGTNFHAVLERPEGADDPTTGRNQWPAELFVFRGASDEDVTRDLEGLPRAWPRSRDGARNPLASATSRPRARPCAAATCASPSSPTASRISRPRWPPCSPARRGRARTEPLRSPSTRRARRPWRCCSRVRARSGRGC